MNTASKLADSLQSGFIDCDLTSLEKYNPKFLINDHTKGMKVLTSIEKELQTCQEFYFSVAFITNSGVTSLISILKELEDRGIKGKIITSQYQNFTEPAALRRLLKFKGIELRIVTEGNFHAKGYIFKHDDSYSFIIGSSNLTQNALSMNKEWNVKLSSLEKGSVMQNIIKEYDYTFENATVVNEQWIETYDKLYKSIKHANQNAIESEENNMISLRHINPNKMQVDALRSIEALRNQGKHKALLISATGTGKTYLSAFDVKKYSPKRFLFIVHRENIARAAMKSFKKVLGYNIDAGLLTGGKHETDSQYIFSTVQTLSKDNVLSSFDKDAFDYIVIDEVHRAGASTYQKVLEHFEPDFLLGMTATPERTDAYDVFSLFDHNIAYEIRLNRALEENMLAPFHYFGVSEIEVDGRTLDDNADFNFLICKERVDRIIEAAEFYGHSGDRTKGLIFCSRKEEAIELSRAFNCRGFNTVALTGDNSESDREAAIDALEADSGNMLDYIFTVDIFNEGVDIPSVNQIIMLRPTQSAIVFVQQLGRGLRKSFGKDYLTVVDFIGNYSNNYLVPIALYGDRSYNKDTVRKLMNTGSSTIPGCSTVHFDQITKERIYKSINNSTINRMSDLKNDYNIVKYERGYVPMMMDFMKLGMREPYAFVDRTNTGSYYEFLRLIDSDNIKPMSDRNRNLLKFYSKEILNGKRLDEAVILALLLANESITVKEVVKTIKDGFGIVTNEKNIYAAISQLNGEFIKSEAADKYGISRNIYASEILRMDPEYRQSILEGEIHKYLDDMIRYNVARFRADYESSEFRDGFILYEKYSRKDVCRILNWEKNEDSTMYGYRIKYNTCPIFVTYHKNDDISESTKYEDEFINPYCFSWMTRSNVRFESKEVIAIDRYEESGLRIPLFVKKSDSEGNDFYYMGDMTPQSRVQEEMYNDKGKVLPVVNYKFSMNDEVNDAMLNYLESN